LPAGATNGAPRPVRHELDQLGPREALRLRARWLHELTARVAREVGIRLAARGVVSGPGDVELLTLAELEVAVRDGVVPIALDDRRLPPGAPLPAAFRLAGERPVPVAPSGGKTGKGVSPGRAVGPAYQGPLPAPAGSVLVVATLDPGLAPHLPRLAGLVAETGNALSHLAILARELGLPCVVGHAGARERFSSGTALIVDGTTGEVAPVEERRP